MTPWDRQRGDDGELEPVMWYGRFRDYLRMGKGRSLLGAINQWRDQQGRKRANWVATAWRKAAEKWHWVERAQNYDLAEEQKVQAEWEERRRQLRETEWARANELLEKVRQMLMFPVAETRRETGPKGEVTIVSPAEWRLRDIPYTFETASKLARLAAGMITNAVDVNVRDLDAAIERELELARRASGVEASLPDEAEATE